MALTEGGLNPRGSRDGYGLMLSAIRGSTAFAITIVVHDARPDLGEFRPCTEAAQAPDGVLVWSPCSQSHDPDGRWRVVGRAGELTGVAIAEGGSAAATVEWNARTNDVTNATQIDGVFADTLTFEEANAFAETAWAVAARYDAEELAAGMEDGSDLDAVKQDWPGAKAALKEVLGPVQEVEVDLTNLGAVTATYSTEAAGHVSIAVWPGVERYYEGPSRNWSRAVEGALGTDTGWP